MHPLSSSCSLLRSNVDCLVLPKGNKKDYDELPNLVKEGLKEVHFVSEYSDVFRIAFPGLSNGGDSKET